MNSSLKNYSLRGLLIVLVVLGHVMTKNPNFVGKHEIYIWIYTFHMPLFLILSGYYGFSIIKKRNFEIIKTTFVSLIIPFIIVSELYVLVSHILYGTRLRISIFQDPVFAMWFILALVFYRLISKLIVKIPNYLVLVFVISLFADYFPTRILDNFDFPRIFSFMIYYFIGFKIREKNIKLQNLTISKVNILLCLVFTILIVVSLAQNSYEFVSTFVKQTDYIFFRDLSLLNFIVYRVVAIILAIINSIVIYSLIKSNRILAYIGKNSYTIYLSHIFLILILKSSIYKGLMNNRTDQFELLIVVMDTFMIIVFILCMQRLIKFLFLQERK